MIIADLFVNLGIKGQDKTIGALTGVENNLKGVASMSLEAKAAIVGAMYALEQLFAKSGAAGTNLTNFAAITGENVKVLQQYQYAARQIGVTNEETEGSFKSLIGAMTKMKLGEGAPKGFGQIAMLTGGITARDVDKFMQNPELLLQKLQDYAQKEKRLGIRNEALKSFGLGDNMIAALSRNAFKPEVLNRAPAYSDKEVASLAKADAAWRNLGVTIGMAVGHLNARFGGTIVKDFLIVVDAGVKFVSMLSSMADKFHLFDRLKEGATAVVGTISELAAMITKAATSGHLFERVSGYVHQMQTFALSLFGVFAQVAGVIKTIGTNSHFFETLPGILGKVFTVAAQLNSIFTHVFSGVVSKVVELGDKFKVFETIGKGIALIFTGISKTLDGLIYILNKVDSFTERPKEAEKEKNEAAAFVGAMPGVFAGLMGDVLGVVPRKTIPETAVTQAQPTPKESGTVSAAHPATSGEPAYGPPVTLPGSTSETTNNVFRSERVETKGAVPAPVVPTSPPILRLVVPPSPILPRVSQAEPRVQGGAISNNTTQNLSVNQTINVPAGSSPQQTGNQVKKAVQDAFRQLSSQVQGS